MNQLSKGMYKALVSILITFIIICNCQSQTKIYGNVVSKKDKGLPFVNVFIKGSFDGSSTDNYGSYSFITSCKGKIILTASFIGYKTIEKEISIETDSVKIDFVLEQLSTSINEIIINAGSIEASDEKRNVVLRAADIGTIAGATGDIMAAMETLPGTQYNGESNGLFVRGGSGNESKVIFDEIPVQNPYYSSIPDIKQRGRFDPFMFSGTVFSTGGYSAVYGQALSSVLVLKSKGLADSTNTGGGIHFYGGRLFHTHRWENTSLHADLNYNNMNPYHKLFNINRYLKSPENLCGKILFRQRFSEDAIFKLYANISQTNMIVDLKSFSDSINNSTFDLTNTNRYFNSSYKEYFKNEEWSVFAGLSLSDDTDDIFLDSTSMSENEQVLQSKFILTNNSIPNLKIVGGFEIQYLKLSKSYEFSSADTEGLLSAGFTEATWHASDKIAVKLGIRYEYSDILTDSNFAPRISFAYKFGENSQLSIAGGSFHQYPLNKYLVDSHSSLDFESATHYIFNYQWNNNDRLLRLELYNKDYNKLIRIDQTSDHINNDGYGYARGVEIFWQDKKSIPNGTYWASYSYLDTRRLYLDYPFEASPNYTSKHNLNLVYKHWIPALNCMVGGTYKFSSGRPYYDPTKNIEEFNFDRTKDYSSLNFNLSWMTKIFKRRSVAYLSINNLFGRDNIFGYRYYEEINSLIPIQPVSKRSIFFGFFISTY